jgi:hypothetical protein
MAMRAEAVTATIAAQSISVAIVCFVEDSMAPASGRGRVVGIGREGEGVHPTG